MNSDIFPTELIATRIILLRGQKVLLDSDLAELYGVETRRLNEQVRRNLARFPVDFAFEVSRHELGDLKSHFATSSWGGRRKLPFAFTEHGAIMAASVLKSNQAVEVSVYVVRAFVQLREFAFSSKAMALRLDALEKKTELISLKNDVFERSTKAQLQKIFEALRALMASPEPPPKRPIGFVELREKDGKPKADEK